MGFVRKKTRSYAVGAVVAWAMLSTSAFAEQARCKVASAGQLKDLTADCGQYNYRVKSGSCKTDCQVSEKISSYNVDLTNVGATTGKRMWTAAAQHSYTFNINNVNDSDFGFGCSKKNKSSNADKCNAYFDTIRNGKNDDFKPYCPDPTKSEFRKQGLAVLPEDICAEYQSWKNCATLRPDYGLPSTGTCEDPSASPSDDPDCGNFRGFNDYNWTRYNQCVSEFDAKYAECYKQTVSDPSNSNLGQDDCYCKSPDEFFKFDTSVGAWKCVPCTPQYPEGFKQDTRSGTSCVSPCGAGQTWDPDARTCTANCTRDSNKEIFPPGATVGGQCMDVCPGNKQRDPVLNSPTYGQCVDVCPVGMIVGAANSCVCNDPRFGATNSRVPVSSTAFAGLRYPVWISTGTVAQSTPPDNSLACACAAAPGSTDVSRMDFAEAITDSDFRNLPYGPVAIVTGTTSESNGSTSNKYSCGCPNLNERFMRDTDGRWKCMSAFLDTQGKRSGEGLILATLPLDADLTSSATRAGQKIVDGSSDSPDRPVAMLRSQASGKDLSVSYRRKVWRCADGYFLNGNQCEPISVDPAQLALNNCTDVGVPVKSSSYLSDEAAAKFGVLTNRMLACCMSQKKDPADPTKFHCVGTDASAYRDFDAFYNAGASAGVDFAGIANPTRLYLKDNNKNPVPGVYTRDGTRCKTLDALTPTQQLAALAKIKDNVDQDRKANPFRGIVGVDASTYDQEHCRFLVRTALEVVCPPPGADSSGNWKTITFEATDPTYLSKDVGGSGKPLVKRCFQADALRVQYDIRDLTHSGTTHRGVFRSVSSIGPNSEPAGSVDISRLIRQNP
jgi:hypothetical protein